MTSPVGPDGQVVIPKHLRDQLEIAPGDQVRFALEGAALRIELVRDAPNLRGRLKGRGLVAELEADHRREAEAEIGAVTLCDLILRQREET